MGASRRASFLLLVCTRLLFLLLLFISPRWITLLGWSKIWPVGACRNPPVEGVLGVPEVLVSKGLGVIVVSCCNPSAVLALYFKLGVLWIKEYMAVDYVLARVRSVP